MKIELPIIFNNYTDINSIIYNYDNDKPGYAREIVNYMTKEEILNNTELKNELNIIKEQINIWNN